ncbi:hypothetical protein FH972_024697 [Carpinus fangiana]|uniref:Uncharacterized protein n=1 Tax=Carpinus fangiana TaxID=176857 RepID=A0A5N6KYR2_9ROSI|nr:hypothetical protein FH972_024697 [Carpinus fangiana]KAB8360966.1 hypothetical protein FH972_024697 [Carpinus fangiana]
MTYFCANFTGTILSHPLTKFLLISPDTIMKFASNENGERRKAFSERHAMRIDLVAAQQVGTSTTDLCTSARSSIRNILRRLHLQSRELIEADLHDLWYTIYRCATITPGDNPEQDKLVVEVLMARELGAPSGGVETGDGTIFTDLPFFVMDMHDLKYRQQGTITLDEAYNLAAFLARLVAVGVRAPQLSCLALQSLSAALEFPSMPSLRENDFATKTSTVERLPAAVSWLKFAGHRLAIYSAEAQMTPCGKCLTDNDLEPGPLAQEAGVIDKGFGPARWNFWRQRFEELREEEDEKRSEWARRGANSMALWSKLVGS